MRRKRKKESNPASQAGAKRPVWRGRFFDKRGAKRNEKEENMKKRTKAEGQSAERQQEKGTPWIKRHGKAALAIALAGTLLVGAGGTYAIIQWAVPAIEKERRYALLDSMEVQTIATEETQMVYDTGVGDRSLHEQQCALPKPGETVINLIGLPDPGYTGYVLRDGDPTPEYPQAEAYAECKAGGPRDSDVDKDRTCSFIPMLRESNATVEVEYLHLRDVDYSMGEVDAWLAYISLDPWVIAECQVKRRIAWREGELGDYQLQPGEVITVLLPGSTRQAFGAVPQLKTGDRAILMLEDPWRRNRDWHGKEKIWKSNYPRFPQYGGFQYIARHTPYFYIPIVAEGERAGQPDYASLNEHLDWNEWRFNSSRDYYGYNSEKIWTRKGHVVEPTGVTLLDDPAIIEDLAEVMPVRMEADGSVGDFARWMDWWYETIPLFPRYRYAEYTDELVDAYTQKWKARWREEDELDRQRAEKKQQERAQERKQ